MAVKSRIQSAEVIAGARGEDEADTWGAGIAYVSEKVMVLSCSSLITS
jgi:hypothetical protein